MNLSISRSATTPLLLFFSVLISFFIFFSYTQFFTEWSPLIYSSSALPLLGVLLVSVLVIVAARAAIVAWITVLVLLAFAGNRRKVLVRRGRKITTDIAMLLLGVLLKERGFLACAATILSFMAVVHIT